MAKRKVKVKERPRHLKYVAPPRKRPVRKKGLVGTYYKGSEMLVIRKNGKILMSSFEELYNQFADGQEERTDRRDGAVTKRDYEIEVWDSTSDGGWTNLIRVNKIPRNKTQQWCILTSDGTTRVGHSVMHYVADDGGNRARYLEEGDTLVVNAPGQSLIPTIRDSVIWALEAHPGHRRLSFRGRPFYGEEGEESRLNGQVTYVAGNNHIQNKILVDHDLGWLIGMALSSGFIAANCIRIVKQNDYMIERLSEVCETKQLGYSLNTRVDNNATTLIIKSRIFADIVQNLFGSGFNDKTSSINPNILAYNLDFVRGIVAGILDGDGRVSDDGDAIVVYCHSRYLMNQLTFIVRLLGHIAIEGLPGAISSGRKPTARSLANYRYAVTYYPSEDVEPVGSTLEKFLVDAEDTPKAFGGVDTRISTITAIVELEDDTDPFLYDISTRSGYFNCNGITSYSFSGYRL